MTADGSDDDRIRMQGLAGPYTFTDADGGEEGAESEAEADEEEQADVEADGEESEEGEEGEASEAEDGMDSSDEEDDTADWACSEAPEQPPCGFTYAPCPQLETDQQYRELIGPAGAGGARQQGGHGLVPWQDQALWRLGCMEGESAQRQLPDQIHQEGYGGCAAG